MSFGKIIDENIRKNLKKIVALVGDIILCTFAIILYAVRAELDLISGLIMILFAFKPYVTTYINLVFKGEAEAAIMENDVLRKEVAYQREIAEWRIQMAALRGEVPPAVMSNEDWNKANEALAPAPNPNPGDTYDDSD